MSCNSDDSAKKMHIDKIPRFLIGETSVGLVSDS